MPLSSAEIAGMSGQFQGLYQQQMTYSGMIGGLMGMNGPPQQQSEQITGGLMNRVGAIAGPAASLGMGMMGLDPLSMGLRAGMGAYGAGAGVMGGAAAGMGVAGMAALPMMAASYAGGQIMTGAQQQQQFNQAMRQSFFFNQPSGQGFANSQLGVMGADIRGMSGQSGAGGEITTFRELSGLAANMGKMGMATGVRDVQAFRQRFQEMLNTVKTVATELGTSLEQAQEAMASMRGSGMFRTADQVKFAMQMRQYSVAGGLSTAELGAMGNIGAQISRSVGGRGAAGAFGGMKTLGTIGSALQTGAISDEDIYNSTGLYGAEGRQALATRQMESAAGFLKTGRGRYFLASVAGRNGHLDEGSVGNWEAGGMDVGETRSQAYKNLRGVGRANFIRNEGRLRGQALEKFGGLLPAMALQQWAEGKGINISQMGDREMLFASRQLGMGMDELETTMKEAKNLPRIFAQQETEGQIDQQLKSLANRRRTQGVEGLKRKFEQAREQVQNTLQQIGADLYSGGSDLLERFINKLAGTYVSDMDADAVRAFKSSMTKEQFGSATGIGRTNRLGGGALGAGGGGRMSSQFFGEGGLLSGFGTSDYDKAVRAGFGSQFDAVRMMRPGAARDQGLVKATQFANNFYSNMAGGGQGSFSFSSDFQGQLRKAYAQGGIAGTQGQERVNALESYLETESFKGNTEARAALMQLKAAPAEQKGAIALGIEQAGKISAGARINTGATGLPGLFGAGSYASRGEMVEARGAALLGQQKWSDRLTRDLAVGVGLSALGPIGLAAMALGAGQEAPSLVLSRRAQMRAGEYTMSSEGKAFARALATGSMSELNSAYTAIEDKYMDLKNKQSQNPGDANLQMELKQTEMQYAAAQVTKQAAASGRPISEEDIKNIAQQMKIDPQALKGVMGGLRQQSMEDHRTIVASIGKAVGGTARGKQADLIASGLAEMKGGQLTLKGKFGKDVELYSKMIGAQSQLYGTGSAGEETLIGQSQEAEQELQSTLWGLSRRELMSRSREQEGAGLYGISQEERRVAAAKRRIEMMERRGGASGAAAQILGLKVDRGNIGFLNALKGKSGEALEAGIHSLMGKAGLDFTKNEELSKELTQALAEPNKERQKMLLSNIMEGKTKGGEQLAAAEKQKKEHEDKEKNPLLDKIEGHLSKIADSTDGLSGQAKVIATNTGITATNTNNIGTKDDPTPAHPPGK
jgi:hypothetical protein